MVNTLRIGTDMVGGGQPCFIIAEAGVNHNGSLDVARQLIDAAVEAKVTAVKFQTFRADMLVGKDAPKADYQIRNTSAMEPQHEMLRRLELGPEAHKTLIDYCRRKHILFLSTPFDEDSADLLEKLGVAAFKIPSGEITNLPFLGHVARKQRPILLSTGMSEMSEVETAVKRIRAQGNDDLVLLHCVSNYPANPADVNLRAMVTMASTCAALAGYSDHTLGMEASLAAVALGACVIEKHFTLDRNLPGPDHKASLEPAELRALVKGIRIVESALGDGIKRPAPSEANTRQIARKSLVAVRDLPAGTTIDETMIAIKRPGTGLPPGMRDELVGRTLKTNVTSGTLLALEMFA
jgi:N,N'-diacetyllegionaminate synthase